MNEVMLTMVVDRREGLTTARTHENDILSLMIQSSEDEGKLAMDDSELVSVRS